MKSARLSKILLGICLTTSLLSVLSDGGASAQTKGGQDDFFRMYVPLKSPVDHADIIALVTTGTLVKAENDLVQIASKSGKLMNATINDQTVICVGNDKKSFIELQALIGHSVSILINVADLKGASDKPVYPVLVKDGGVSITIKMKPRPAADGTTADMINDPNSLFAVIGGRRQSR